MPVCASVAKLFCQSVLWQIFHSLYSWQWQNWSISNLAAICQHCNRWYTSLSECYPQIVATAGSLADTQTNVETIPHNSHWARAVTQFMFCDSFSPLTAGLRGWQQDWEADSRTYWQADSRTERLTAGLMPIASVQNKQEKFVCLYKNVFVFTNIKIFVYT